MRILFGATLVLASWTVQAAPIELITNGDFEAGLAGWTITDQAGGSGSWFASAPGAATPLSFTATSALGGSPHGAGTLHPARDARDHTAYHLEPEQGGRTGGEVCRSWGHYASWRTSTCHPKPVGGPRTELVDRIADRLQPGWKAVSAPGYANGRSRWNRWSHHRGRPHRPATCPARSSR